MFCVLSLTSLFLLSKQKKKKKKKKSRREFCQSANFMIFASGSLFRIGTNILKVFCLFFEQ